MNDRTEDESKRLQHMKKEIIQRLETSEKCFWTYKRATWSFQVSVWMIILIDVVYLMIALGITLGWI